MPAPLVPASSPFVKPTPGATLDPNGPFSVGLKVAVPFNEGGGRQIREHVTGLYGVAGSATTWKASPFGPALNFPQDTTNGFVEWAGFPQLTTNSGGYTVFVYHNAAGTGTSAFGAWFSAPEPGGDLGMWWNGAQTSISIDYNGLLQATSGLSTAANVWQTLSALTSGEMIVNRTLTSSGSSGSGQTLKTYLRIGFGSFGTAFNGSIGALYIWNRALTYDERVRLSVEPYAPFRQQGALRRYWMFGKSAGGVVVTRDVTTDAAITATVSRSITTDAAISATVTRDVTTDAAMTATVTRDVTTDAALTATVVANVTTDAATTAPVSRDVTTDAALTATVTRDVTSDAAVSTTATRDVTSDSAISATAKRDVTSDAAVTATVTASVTTDAAASLTVTRDVTTDAALSTTATASVTTDAAITATVVANVTTDAALTATVTRDVTSDASILVPGHVTADVTTDAALSATVARDVASDAAITAAVTRDVTTDAATSTAAPVTGAITLHEDTFTLAFTGAIALSEAVETIALSGQSMSGVIALIEASDVIALVGAHNRARGAIALSDGSETIALTGRAIQNGTITLKEGSANAPLLHLVAPQVASVGELFAAATALTASRSRAGGAGTARLIPRTADGAALPAAQWPVDASARVSLRRAAGGTVETVGRFEGDAEGVSVVVTWPDDLPWLGLYFAALEVESQRCPPLGYVPVLVEA